MADHNTPKNCHKPPGNFEDVSLLKVLLFYCRKTEILSPYHDRIRENPVGTLQEMCVSRHWLQPSHQLLKQEGSPHDCQFTMSCVVLQYQETGKLEVCIALGTPSTIHRRGAC